MSTTSPTSSQQARSSSGSSATIAIKTDNGKNYLTVVDNGGVAATSGKVAIDSSQKTPGANETFVYVPMGPGKFALQTPNGKNYVTATNGGGKGGSNDGTCPIHTNATQIGPWETLTLTWLSSPQAVAISTSSGYYLTAINGGGIGDGGKNTSPIHTDATKVGPWETFTIGS